MLLRSSGGVGIALHDLGGDGDPLLICHATGFCGRAYEPLAAVLAARFRVWAVDLRAHGDSTSPADGDFSWTGMADDALAAVDAIGVSSIRGFGHTLGGAVLLLAELARPGVVSLAYLYEPVVFPPDFRHVGDDNPMAAPARRRREVFDSRADALWRYAGRPPLGELRADALAAYVEHGFEDLDDGTVRLKCRADDEARTFEAETKMTIDRVEGLAVPTVVAVGERSGEPGPAAFAPDIAAAMRHARLVRYPHLGHFGPLQDPETIAADIISMSAQEPAGQSVPVGVSADGRRHVVDSTT